MGFWCLFVFLFCFVQCYYDNIVDIVDISQFSLLIFLTGNDEFLDRKMAILWSYLKWDAMFFLKDEVQQRVVGQTERRGGDTHTSSVCGSPDSRTSLSFLVPSSQQFPKYFLDLHLFPSMAFIYFCLISGYLDAVSNV